jgi:hypothetical protein
MNAGLTLSGADVVGRRRSEAEGVDLTRAAEVVHLVVEDDAIGGHDLASPVEVLVPSPAIPIDMLTSTGSRSSSAIPHRRTGQRSPSATCRCPEGRGLA